jgi:hypothetical protein
MPHLAICTRCNFHLFGADKSVLVTHLRHHFARKHKHIPDFTNDSSEEFLFIRLTAEEYDYYKRLTEDKSTRGEFTWSLQHQKMILKAAAARAR